MATRKVEYFRSMNNMGSEPKKIKTGSIFGTISSVITGGEKANIKATSESENRDINIALPYGFACFPFKNMKAHILSTGKHRDIVGMIDSKRPKTKQGEVIIYTRDGGSKIKLDNKGNIVIETDTKVTVKNSKAKLEISGNEVTITGNLNVVGKITATDNISTSANISAGGSITAGGSVSSSGFSAPGGVWHSH